MRSLAGRGVPLPQLEKVEFEEPRYELKDCLLPFLLVAVVLLLLGRLLKSTVLEVLP